MASERTKKLKPNLKAFVARTWDTCWTLQRSWKRPLNTTTWSDSTCLVSPALLVTECLWLTSFVAAHPSWNELVSGPLTVKEAREAITLGGAQPRSSDRYLPDQDIAQLGRSLSGGGFQGLLDLSKYVHSSFVVPRITCDTCHLCGTNVFVWQLRQLQPRRRRWWRRSRRRWRRWWRWRRRSRRRARCK